MPPTSLRAWFSRNPAPGASLALAALAVVMLALTHTTTGSGNGAYEGALIAAIVAMITGGIGLLTALKFGALTAVLSLIGFSVGLVVLVVGLNTAV